MYSTVRISAVTSQLDASLKQLGVTDVNGTHIEGSKTDKRNNTNSNSNSHGQLDIPYIQGVHPLKKHYVLVVESLKGEELMWTHAFPNDTSEECVESFIEICTYVIGDLSDAFLPFFPTTPIADKSNIGVLAQVSSFCIVCWCVFVYL